MMLIKSIEKLTLTGLFITSLFLVGCPDHSLERMNAIKITDSVKQSYAGGAGGYGSRGTIYQVQVQFDLSDTVFIDSVWIGDNFVQHDLKNKEGALKYLTLKGDASIIANIVRTVKNNNPPPPPPAPGGFPIEEPKKEKSHKTPTPPKYEGAAFVKYRLKGNSESFIVTEFKTGKKIQTQ